jgi:hypothetical protein
LNGLVGSRRRFALSMGALGLLAAVVLAHAPVEKRGFARDLVIAQAPEGPITYGELVNGRSDYFAADVRRALGRRFAGLWLTNDTIYNVGVVRPTEDDRSKVAELARPYGATGVVVPAHYTAGELGRFNAALERIPLKMWERSLCSSGGDPVTNRIKVVLWKHDQPLIRRIKQIVPADALTLTVNTQDGPYCGFTIGTG